MTSLLLIAAAIGMPSYVFSRPYLTVNAAINRPQVTMWISFITLALKAPLNAIFMYGWLGVPALGGAGAGVAAAINGYVGLVAYIVIWKTSSHYKGMYPAKFYWPEWHSIAQHLKIGLPISLSTFFEVSSFTLMAIFIARLGTFTVAAHQIVANITAAIYQIPLSLGIAASVLVAQCCGARELILARQASIRILKLALTIAALFSVLLFLLRSPLASLYTKDAQVIEIASNLLIFGAVYHVFDAMQTISAFALRGYKVTFLPMMIYGVLLWSLGLGGGYWFCFGAKEFGGPYGAGGFWGAVRVGLVLAGLALMAFLLFVSNERAKDKHHVWFRSERFKALLKKAPKNRF